jgi:hypothetical protein
VRLAALMVASTDERVTSATSRSIVPETPANDPLTVTNPNAVTENSTDEYPESMVDKPWGMADEPDSILRASSLVW